MVLAAGLGKRMRPLTATLPKPLVKVGGRALVDHALDRLADAGVETAIVNVHYLADRVIDHLKARRRPRVLISDERAQLMETGGGVVKALPLLGEEPFYLINSDSFWIEGPRPNLATLFAAWQSAAMDALLMLAPATAAVGYEGAGDFFMDTSGRLAPRPERQVAPFVYTGVAIVNPSAMFADAPEGPFSLNILIDRVSEAGRLFGVRMDGMWFHVGTPAAVDEAERALVSSAA
ncbi:MAG: nucleotidyltransferase family protein [Bauldia sp.]|nr:nucleotidyltransferase family protein [Bauldia sp.]